MTIDPGQEGEAPRRRFDDVTSLFGAIVPPAGIARPVISLPIPRAPREAEPPPPPPPVVEPEPEPELEPASGLEPKPPPRARPIEVPWPDAFEPRPNYRRREPRNWSWLLLIPVAFVAAVGITSLDPAAIRSWLLANVFHRSPPPPALVDFPLLPALPSTPASAPAPQPEAPASVLYPALPTSPLPTSPLPTSPLPTSPLPTSPLPTSPLPTSPLPVPPGAEVSPPPVNPVKPAAPAAPAPPIHITIQYRRNIPGSDGEARRVAALLQSHSGSIELHPNVTTVRVPTITYYNPADKAAATALTSVLANEAASWVVRAGTAKTPPRTLEVWMP